MSKHPKLISAWKYIFLMFDAKFFMESPKVVNRELSFFAISFYNLQSSSSCSYTDLLAKK